MLEEDNDERNSIGLDNDKRNGEGDCRKAGKNATDCSNQGECKLNVYIYVLYCKCNGDYTGNKCQTPKGRSYLMMVIIGVRAA